MGSATQVLCARLRCYRSCCSRRKWASQQPVALDQRPQSHRMHCRAVEQRRRHRTAVSHPAPALPRPRDGSDSGSRKQASKMTTMLAERRKRASRARIAGADGKSATFSPCSERIHHLHSQQRQVASHLAAALALQHLTSHRNRSTRLHRSSDIESAHENKPAALDQRPQSHRMHLRAVEQRRRHRTAVSHPAPALPRPRDGSDNGSRLPRSPPAPALPRPRDGSDSGSRKQASKQDDDHVG